MNLNDVTVIIRSAKERTLAPCRHLLSGLFSNEQIHIIEESPFSKALKNGLEIGAERDRKWTMTIDADVLVDVNGVIKLSEKAVDTPEHFFAIQGLILDKFFPIFRPSGIHFYRTSFINKAIQLIPDEGSSLRPESDLLDNMTAAGHPWLQCDAVVGVHDFEQYYKDIFRKCFIQAHKHHWLINLAEEYWNSQKDMDRDFQIALWGVLSGKIHDGKVSVDRNFLQNEIAEILALKNITEKPPLFPQDFRTSFVDETIENYHQNISPLIRELQSKMFPVRRWEEQHGINEKIPDTGRHSGFFQKMMFYSGALLVFIGCKLKALSRYES